MEIAEPATPSQDASQSTERRALTGTEQHTLQTSAQAIGRSFRGVVPFVGILAKASHANRVQIGGNRRLYRARRQGILGTYLVDDFEQGIRSEWRPACQDFIKDGSQCVYVSPGTDKVCLPLGQFGCHVARRAQDGPALSLPRARVETFGQTEVGNLR